MSINAPSNDPLTERIIACAIAVHRELGPGLLESTYEQALRIELEDEGLSFEHQKTIPVLYKGRPIGNYRLDLLVEGSVVVEIKSVERLQPVFDAQVLTYLKVSGTHTGLILNFNTARLKDGIKRLVL